ncbi:MAG TPA: aldo/keto reductase, partial [Chitinophagaceae bacterium]|nr:aldo/keto reductase [Chitinophagaceae bacterium]
QRNIDDKIVIDYSREYVLRACEESLKRLKRETIDYYQLHAARMPHLQNGECIEAMELLKQQGKVRYWGLSLNTFAPAPEAEWMMEHKAGDGFQLVFNLINKRAYGVMQQAANNGYGIIARMPFQFGLLTGKFSPNTTFDANDHRSFRLTPEIIEKSMKVLEQVDVSAAKALSFILTCKEVSTVIPGIRTPEHVKQNTTGIQTLSPEEQEHLLSMDWKPVMELMEKQG